jgi:hypothetical protein
VQVVVAGTDTVEQAFQTVERNLPKAGGRELGAACPIPFNPVTPVRIIT